MQGSLPIVTLSWSLGLAFVVGVVSAVVVNWVLWPFVARHELRKSISAMLFHSAIIYRGVVSKYIYYEDGQAPGKDDIERSEELEGRLREGFVRIRQLMVISPCDQECSQRADNLTGADSSRNSATGPFQSSTLFCTHRELRVLLRAPYRSPAGISVLSPQLYVR